MAFDIIQHTDWGSLNTAENIDAPWKSWHKAFMSIMERCIPSKVLPPWRRNLPWINKNLVQSMRKRDNLYRRFKRSGNPIDLEKFKRLRNSIVSQIRLAKENYFNQLDPFNSKQF